MKCGSIEVITGPMFAGKTEELIRRAKRMEYAKKSIIVFKPRIDDRYSVSEIVSHDNRKALSINIDCSSDILKHITDDIEVIIIDEVQFLDYAIASILDDLANKGKKIIVAGLDKDFRGEPFGVMPTILAIAEEVTKLTAICVVCGENATYTQRLIKGQPAHINDQTLLVGAEETYEARCRCHHEVRRD